MIKKILEEIKEGKMKLVGREDLNFHKVTNSLLPIFIDEYLLKEQEKSVLFKTIPAPMLEHKKTTVGSGYVDGSSPWRYAKGLRKIENGQSGEFWFLGYPSQVVALNSDFNTIYTYFTNKVGSLCFDVSYEHDLLVIGYPFLVEVVRLSTSEIIATIGTGSSGNVKDGKLYYVNSVTIVDADTIYISNYYGSGDVAGVLSGYDDGTIVKYLIATDSLELLLFRKDSLVNYQELDVYRPAFTVKNADSFFVYTRDVIIEYKIDLTTKNLSYFKTHSKPTGTEAIPSFTEFSVTSTEIIIPAYNMNKVIGLNRDNGNISFYAGHYEKITSQSEALLHKENGLAGVRSAVEISDTHMLVLDTVHDACYKMSKLDYEGIKYEIPTNIEIVFADIDIDENGVYLWQIGTKVKDLNLVYSEK